MMRKRNESKTAQMFVAGLILAAALLYFPPYAWAWVGDDYVQLGYVLGFLERPFTAFQLFNPYSLPWYYRPLQNGWFLVNRLVFGLNPAAFYWQMVLWHALAVALMYRVLRQFGVGLLAAALATALFALHGHYVDVVGWNSSVAIVMAAVFSLASLSFYLTAERAEGAEKTWRLSLCFLFFLLALLAHEEAVLLPLFLVVLTLVQGKKQKAEGKRQKAEGKKQKAETSPSHPITPSSHHPIIPSPPHPITSTPHHLYLLVGMLALTAVFILIQFNRPNLTIDLGETPAGQWWELVSPVKLSQFVKDLSLRYTLTLNWDAAQQIAPILLALAIFLLLGAWFLWGNWTVRLGLIWVLLHVGLIYATLYQARPNLLAGRHFYQASIGLALALGGSMNQLLALSERRLRLGRWRVSMMAVALVAVVTAVLLSHISSALTTQQAWLARAERDNSARAQLQALLPEIGTDTRLFAHRFPVTPKFLRAVTEVWYELGAPLPMPSGSLAQLRLHGKATQDYYVFDYEAGRLYNLMPELQWADETEFIWSREPRLDVVAGDGAVVESATERGEQGLAVVGPPDDRRFAVKLAPVAVVDGWLSLAYVIPEVPAGSNLRLGIRTDAPDGAPVRVRLDPAPGDPVTLYEGRVTGEWLDLTESMGEYAGQAVVLRLETAVAPGGTVYWGNPRFVTASLFPQSGLQ